LAPRRLWLREIVGCERVTTVDNIPLCIASGGNINIVQTIFSLSRKHLAVIGENPDSSWRVLTFAREEPPASGPIWAEVGAPSTAGSLPRAEALAKENLRSLGADL
jgi:hypothetical protein